MKWQAHWIWTDQDDKLAERNRFVRFRRRFAWNGGKAVLHITADSRYILYVNGEYRGQGPARGWPQYYQYDSYDLTSYLREGENTSRFSCSILARGISSTSWGRRAFWSSSRTARATCSW